MHERLDPGPRSLRVAALMKQVPADTALALDPAGRLVRGGAAEMNAFCRRAVATAIDIAARTGGESVGFTLGPPSARDVLTEAVTCGIDRGVHLCGPEFAGSDTVATARALVAALRLEGPFDLVLVGRGSSDSDTGSIGPQVAELLDLPFAGPVRSLDIRADGATVDVDLQHDGVGERVRVRLPAVLSVAERLIKAASAPAEDWLDAAPIVTRRSAALDGGQWGVDGSRTQVGQMRKVGRDRAATVLQGSLASQVRRAVDVLVDRGAFAVTTTHGCVPSARPGGPAVVAAFGGSVHTETRALLGSAAQLAAEINGHVVGVGGRPDEAGVLASWGADRVFVAETYAAGALARAMTGWLRHTPPWAILAVADAWGRELTARLAAALDAGLIADSLGLRVVNGRLIGEKAAFGGQLAVDISCSSTVQCATVRPGVNPLLVPRRASASVEPLTVQRDDRIACLSSSVAQPDRPLGRAGAVIGVGLGVTPEDYRLLDPLLSAVDGVLGATRKVTDRSWLPHDRQIGSTGRAVAPALYIALGISGATQHLAGLHAAGSILAVNVDADAPIFTAADVGIVADWRAVVPLLAEEFSRRRVGVSGRQDAAAVRPVHSATMV